MIAGMHWIDVVVMLAYLLGVTALGVRTVRKVRGVNDYFMPRRFGTSQISRTERTGLKPVRR